MKWPKLRELKEAVTAVVKGPYTHPFPAEPTPLPAWIRGRPTYDDAGCIGCGACAEACPARAIEVRTLVKDRGTVVRQLTVHYDHCIFCAECARSCSTGEGIRLSQDYELSGFDRRAMQGSIEKELVLCELCESPIAPKDHLLWIYRRLGALAYANITVYLAAQDALGLREHLHRDARPLDRTDIQRVLCPACRRSVTLMDEWGPV